MRCVYQGMLRTIGEQVLVHKYPVNILLAKGQPSRVNRQISNDSPFISMLFGWLKIIQILQARNSLGWLLPSSPQDGPSARSGRRTRLESCIIPTRCPFNFNFLHPFREREYIYKSDPKTLTSDTYPTLRIFTADVLFLQQWYYRYKMWLNTSKVGISNFFSSVRPDTVRKYHYHIKHLSSTCSAYAQIRTDFNGHEWSLVGNWDKNDRNTQNLRRE